MGTSIDKKILEKAVALGIISDDQLARILALAAAPDKGGPQPYGEDERFRLISGFNDIFLALGVALFGVGVYGGSVVFGGLMTGSVFGAVAMWLLSELFAARLRLTLPSMIAATGFCLFVVSIAFVQIMQCGFGTNEYQVCPDFDEGPVMPLLMVYGSGAAAALVYYLRFRLPFSLFLLAAALYATALVWMSRTLDFGTDGVDDIGRVIQLTSFVFGMAVFALAMAFDLSDRERMTRRADAAFWLHLAAAPLIVHSIMYNLASGEGQTQVFGYIAILGVFLLLMYFALAIDRRAVLVAALAYVGTVVAFVINRFGSAEASLFFTLIALGVSVIVLGVGWRPLRRAVLNGLPDGLVRMLPVAR